MLKNFINFLSKFLLILICWFIVLELFARVIINEPSFYNRYIKNVSDAGFRLEWIIKHNHKNDPVAAGVGGWNIYSPSRGWRLKPNLTNFQFLNHKTINTNSKGIRGKKEFTYEKTPGKTRILILGDSYTFGDEVNDTETYPYYLQEILPNTEVINFGVNAYGHDQMLIYLMEEGLKYHPDIILLGYVPLDNVRNLSEFFYGSKPRFCWRENQLVLRNNPVPSPQWLLKIEFWRSKFFDLAGILIYEFLNKTGVIDQEAMIITNHILDKIVRIARASDARLIIVPICPTGTNLPSLEQFQDVALKPLLWFGSSEDVLKGHHYSPIVNQRIAQGIKRYLLDKNIIK